MPAINQQDLLSLGGALGPGGHDAARRILPFANDTYSDVGSTALSSAYARVDEMGFGPIQRTKITLTSLPITMTDEPGVVAYGGSKVYDMPAGNILILGATQDLSVTKSGAGINADFDGDVGLGTTTAGNNNALATTEQNIIPTTSTPQAVAGVTTADGINAAAIAPLDGTTTPIDIYLNFLIDDADQDGGGTLLVSGTIIITWINLGDK